MNEFRTSTLHRKSDNQKWWIVLGRYFPHWRCLLIYYIGVPVLDTLEGWCTHQANPLKTVSWCGFTWNCSSDVPTVFVFHWWQCLSGINTGAKTPPSLPTPLACCLQVNLMVFCNGWIPWSWIAMTDNPHPHQWLRSIVSHIHTHMHKCEHTHMHKCEHTHAHAHAHTRTHAQTHTHRHTHTLVWQACTIMQASPHPPSLARITWCFLSFPHILLPL